MLICEAVEPDGKTCSVCGTYKPLDLFSRQASCRNGRKNQCKECWKKSCADWHSQNRSKRGTHHRRYTVSKYGLTLEGWEARWDSQGGLCAICKDQLRRGTGGHATDHCHTSGKFRSILCPGCNIGLGMFRDDPARLLSAAAYLKEHHVSS